ncbi:MAG: hypothetical protein H7Z13_11760 [Ferruginibacter sp.]|nr:hypothetical protein [Ferruginibacter sp.]
MRIEYFLFTIYLLLSFWLIPKISFIKHSNLTIPETWILFTFKIVSGIAAAFYFETISTNVDYLANNAEGNIQYQLLVSNPKLFFTDFTIDINTYGLGSVFETKDSFWGYLRFNLLYKFIAILNLITQGNFYFNTIIFCSIVFFGHIAFYRIYSEIYKGCKLTILFASFCLPSLLMYTSCVHKDGIIFLSIGLVSYIFHRFLSSPRSLNIKYALFFLLGMTTIFLFRNYVIIAILPAMLTAMLCKVLRYKKRFVFLISYSIFFLLFFLSGFSKSFLNLPAAVVQRRADFAALAGANTDIPMNSLYPTLQSFIFNLPQAINHSLFRPYLWEFSQLPVLLTALELLMYQLILLTFIFFRKKQPIVINDFNIFGFAFLFNMMLIIGYTIPNIGAIVRYRSIFWIYLIVPALCNIDWRKWSPFQKIKPL